MLTSLLPGIRDLRAPLTAGSLLLACSFVLLEGTAGRLTREDRLGPGLVALDDRLGDRGWLVVTGVAAYLVGSVFVSGRNSLVRQLAARSLPGMTTTDYLHRKQTAWESVIAPFSRPSLRRLGVLHGPDHDPVLAQRVCVDILFGGGKRLLVANKDLYGEYDRLTAEAEFRDAVTLPGLAFVAIVLANIEGTVATEVALASFGLLVGLILTAQARGLDRQANSMYAHAVADGIVSTAVLDQPDKDGRRRWVDAPAPARPASGS